MMAPHKLQLVDRTATPAPNRPAVRAFAPSYRSGEANRCPGCGHSNWWVGRTTAECAVCHTAVPIAKGGPNA